MILAAPFVQKSHTFFLFNCYWDCIFKKYKNSIERILRRNSIERILNFFPTDGVICQNTPDL